MVPFPSPLAPQLSAFAPIALQAALDKSGQIANFTGAPIMRKRRGAIHQHLPGDRPNGPTSPIKLVSPAAEEEGVSRTRRSSAKQSDDEWEAPPMRTRKPSELGGGDFGWFEHIRFKWHLLSDPALHTLHIASYTSPHTHSLHSSPRSLSAYLNRTYFSVGMRRSARRSSGAGPTPFP